MKKIIYQVEVGVLLPKHHHEYKNYSIVYDKQYSYYNECIWFCESLEEAKASALDYVKKGVARTYAIVSTIHGFDDQEHTIINGNVCYKEDELYCSCEFTDFSIESVVYSIVKNNNALEECFVKKYNID